MRKKRVLFLCTGNSARSQMAEGLTNHFLGEQWEAHSAGTHPADRVHPLAVEVMAELGIDISNQRPKPVSEFNPAEFDLVITLCDQAAAACPACLGWRDSTHIGFPDPAAFNGTPAERLAAFRRVRDAIRDQVLTYLERFAERARVPIGNE